jgi:lipopolysaccharide transport system ATP-binding protein
LVLVQHVSKLYRLYRKPWLRLLPGPAHHEDFWALRDVSCRAAKGEFLGIVGPNGSGKSTLLQIVAGVLTPSSGRVRVEGRKAALLELGAGFNPEFTGRENVRLSSEIYGLSRREIDQRLPLIEDFAGIGTFIDRPVKEYSSGMYVRLAFSTAIHVEPDVLIVDEALAVGDAIFSSKCIRKFEELRQRGVTTVFVSHDLGLVKRLCDRAILLWRGQVDIDGPPSEVVNRYVGLVLEREKADSPETPVLAAAQRHGDGTSRIESLRMFNAAGEETRTLLGGQTARVRIQARFLKDCPHPMAGLLIRNRLGMDIFGTNTKVEGLDLPAQPAGARVEVEFSFPCLLAGQDYTLTAAMQHDDGSSHDWLDDALSFTVINSRLIAGSTSLPTEVCSRNL